MMTLAMIWLAQRGKLWVLWKKSLLRQQGEPPAGCSILPDLWASSLDCELLEGRVGAECTSASVRHWAHSGCSVNTVG